MFLETQTPEKLGHCVKRIQVIKLKMYVYFQIMKLIRLKIKHLLFVLYLIDHKLKGYANHYILFFIFPIKIGPYMATKRKLPF